MKQIQNEKCIPGTKSLALLLMTFSSLLLLNSCSNDDNKNGFLKTTESRIRAVDTIMANPEYQKEYLDSKKNNTEILFAMNFQASQVWAIFRESTVTYVELSWVKSGNDVTLRASGKNSNGIEITNSPLTPIPDISSPNSYNFPRRSPIFLKRGQVKALIGLGTADVITQTDCKDIVLLPNTTSTSSRNYNLYYTGFGEGILRDANPMPPFTAPCRVNCDLDN